MISSDAPSEFPGQPPPGGEQQPTEGNETDPNISPNAIPIDNRPTAAQSQENNYNQQPNWRGRLRNIMQRFPRADVWLALFTGFLVVETFMTIHVLTTTDQALHKTADAQQKSAEIADRIREITESTERPWVGPNDAQITGLVKDKPFKISATLQNSGRQPAEMNTHSRVIIFKGDDWKQGFYKADVFAWETGCIEKKVTESDPVRLIFPGVTLGSSAYRLTVDTAETDKKINATDEIVSGDDVTALLGCFIYETFKTTRHTVFCYYWAKGGDMGHLTYCPVGQYAN